MVPLTPSLCILPRIVPFAYGFRPFFLLGGLQALLTVAVWVLAVTGHLGAALPPASWHGHEMVFGFAITAVAGFLLTAVPNWTGSVGLSGRGLAALVALWLAGRLAVVPGIGVPEATAAVVDLAFLPALALALASPLVRARKLRNLVFLPILAVLWVANLLIHLEWLGWTATAATGLLLAINLVLVMIAVIGGRIIPLFTQSGLRQAGVEVTIAPRPILDRLALGALIAMAAVDLVLPDGIAAGMAALAAAGLHGARLAGWRGGRTLGRPILWVLHVAYLWLPLGLALKGIWFLAAPAFAAGWLHALTVGAIGTIILGVTTRVALGHTGRPLVVARPIALAYGFVTLAAVARVVASGLGGAAYEAGLMLSGGAWVAAFSLFLWVYVPILLAPRADGRPG
ncbi:MAG TPA: NnrS family protein [Azospirillaceae bacterium]|nr:NnrS family protein [Azospirillaceae bacterium]